ncbi:MAG: carbohydrate-binding family 9-like protein [Candidatus Latescibacterota bacterium]
MSRFLPFLLLAGLIVPAVSAEPPQYTVKRATGKIVIDGILDEADWSAASSVGAFQFPWWSAGDKEQTQVKILWDDKFLYISYKADDKHIWADHYDTNGDTCLDDCVEIFWNPNPDAGNSYHMFEMNCLGNLLSVTNNLTLKRSIKERESRILPPHIGQTLQGTVNNDADADTGWILEVAIRFEDYTELSGGNVPKDGDIWRAGLNRCGGKTNEQYSQWSPSRTPTPSFHAPNDFGKLVFSLQPVK